MTGLSSVPNNPLRGEVWLVNFEPQKGQEIKKTRPALVIGHPNLGNLMLRIVVPILSSVNHHQKYFWYVYITASTLNGLKHDGEIDASQVRSLSVERFETKLGTATKALVDDVSTAIALCTG